MAIEEQETILTFNRADMRDGYFTFGTSEAASWAKMCKRVGGEQNVLDVRKSTHDGKVTYFTGKIPVKYAGAYWSIGRGVKRVLSRERVEESRARMEAMRAARAKKESP